MFYRKESSINRRDVVRVLFLASMALVVCSSKRPGDSWSLSSPQAGREQVPSLGRTASTSVWSASLKTESCAPRFVQ